VGGIGLFIGRITGENILVVFGAVLVAPLVGGITGESTGDSVVEMRVDAIGAVEDVVSPSCVSCVDVDGDAVVVAVACSGGCVLSPTPLLPPLTNIPMVAAIPPKPIKNTTTSTMIYFWYRVHHGLSAGVIGFAK